MPRLVTFAPGPVDYLVCTTVSDADNGELAAGSVVEDSATGERWLVEWVEWAARGGGLQLQGTRNPPQGNAVPITVTKLLRNIPRPRG
jgi:hypothetical protein